MYHPSLFHSLTHSGREDERGVADFRDRPQREQVQDREGAGSNGLHQPGRERRTHSAGQLLGQQTQQNFTESIYNFV